MSIGTNYVDIFEGWKRQGEFELLLDGREEEWEESKRKVARDDGRRRLVLYGSSGQRTGQIKQHESSTVMVLKTPLMLHIRLE
jgi:hypothetical protein